MRGLLVFVILLATAHTVLAREPNRAAAASTPPSRPLIVPAPNTPSQLCQAAIAGAERRLAIAPGLLPAIGLAESGRQDPALGRAAPWPWTINVAGEDHVFATKAEAVAAVQVLQQQGIRSIDVGCVQVNLMWHPDAFATLDEAFEPETNVAYGARFLKSLFVALGSWEAAAGAYHSQTPTLAEPYRQRVIALWTGVKAAPPVPVSLNTNADVYGSWPPPGTAFAAMPPANFAFRCCVSGTAAPAHSTTASRNLKP